MDASHHLRLEVLSGGGGGIRHGVLTVIPTSIHGLESPIRRRGGITVCIIQGDRGDRITPPDEDGPDRREEQSDEKEGGQDALGRQDGLPGFETLLLEGGVCRYVIDVYRQ